ncbi:serpin family protein [Fowlpox virus]|nr:serpin family protein [Fowlpox virus]CAE52556.1 putative serine protease inhibitor [Fowlpox virus isolate HP-438/Munich]AXY04451.1 serpin family protein [Fowlpox virus]AXY04713.1 serpin family protein [Fowlpox virus]AYO89604.1 serpin family protein [Fowlpox virus]
MGSLVRLLKELYVPGKDICISPRGVYTILMNIMIGCKKETRDKIKDLLGIFGNYVPIPDKSEYYVEYYDDKDELINKSIMLIEEGYPIKRDFINSSYDIFNAKVVSFTDDTISETINKWVELSTRGLIKDFSISLADDIRLAIINVLYFKSKWKYPFDTELTSKHPFKKYNGTDVMIDTMMIQDVAFYYKHDEDIRSQVVMLEYEDYRFVMFIIIPDSVTGIDGVVDSLNNGKNINKIISKKDMTLKEIVLYLPKFELEDDVDLKDALIHMGCNDLFKSGELVGISDTKTLRIGNIRQKSVIKVDEYGTEAASVTELCTTDGIKKIPIVKANVPFMFLVADVQTKIPLFLGIFQG